MIETQYITFTYNETNHDTCVKKTDQIEKKQKVFLEKKSSLLSSCSIVICYDILLMG